MKKLFMLALTALPLISVAGQPKISVLKDELTALWDKCPEVKVVDIRKINGIQYGRRYEMAYSFRIKLEEYSTFDKFCPNGDIVQGKNLQKKVLREMGIRAGLKHMNDLSTGSELTANAVAEFIKTDNGWIYTRDITTR